MPRRERRSVVAAEAIGPYMLLRLERGELDPGIPGQFFMLEAPGRLLPRPLSLCLAPPGELAFLIDPIGPGTGALCALEPGDAIARLRPARERLPPRRRAAAARRRRHRDGAASVSRRSAALPAGRARLPQRAARRGGGARCPDAEVAIDPTFVTELIPVGLRRARVRPEPMLHAVGELCPGAQLAWEAPMACGYGACYGCAVEIDGELKRLCVEGPVLVAA